MNIEITLPLSLKTYIKVGWLKLENIDDTETKMINYFLFFSGAISLFLFFFLRLFWPVLSVFIVMMGIAFVEILLIPIFKYLLAKFYYNFNKTTYYFYPDSIGYSCSGFSLKFNKDNVELVKVGKNYLWIKLNHGNYWLIDSTNTIKNISEFLNENKYPIKLS